MADVMTTTYDVMSNAAVCPERCKKAGALDGNDIRSGFTQCCSVRPLLWRAVCWDCVSVPTAYCVHQSVCHFKFADSFGGKWCWHLLLFGPREEASDCLIDPVCRRRHVRDSATGGSLSGTYIAGWCGARTASGQPEWWSLWALSAPWSGTMPDISSTRTRFCSMTNASPSVSKLSV